MSNEVKESDSDKKVKIQQLFKLMVESGASDLHITAGIPPGLRVNGKIVRIKISSFTQDDTKRVIYQVLTEEQKNVFEKNLDLDFAFGIKGLGRFRANIFYSKGGVAAVFRLIPTEIPNFVKLGFPDTLLKIANIPNGLIIVTGPTGSGKSTTLAAIIDSLNASESGHIITLEDPVEFVHSHKGCIVNQREIGIDTIGFNNAVKSILRQDPDIVLVGELRDSETIEAALTIAETGHLVFGTLHTNSTIQAINRIIDVFSAGEQEQIRTLLSFVLQGIIAQQLVRKSFDPGRVCVQEILRLTPAIRNLIRENKIHQIYSQMQIGQNDTEMVTMNQSLLKFLDKGLIDQDTAISYSTLPEELLKKLGIKK